MDSDGRVAAYFGSDTRLPGFERHFLGDGLWHMATLTTLSDDPEGLRGHAMYLDGALVALQRANQVYAGQHLLPQPHKLPLLTAHCHKV